MAMAVVKFSGHGDLTGAHGVFTHRGHGVLTVYGNSVLTMCNSGVLPFGSSYAS